jgi:hypothetical protein
VAIDSDFFSELAYFNKLKCVQNGIWIRQDLKAGLQA